MNLCLSSSINSIQKNEIHCESFRSVQDMFAYNGKDTIEPTRVLFFEARRLIMKSPMFSKITASIYSRSFIKKTVQ